MTHLCLIKLTLPPICHLIQILLLWIIILVLGAAEVYRLESFANCHHSRAAATSASPPCLSCLLVGALSPPVQGGPGRRLTDTWTIQWAQDSCSSQSDTKPKGLSCCGLLMTSDRTNCNFYKVSKTPLYLLRTSLLSIPGFSSNFP